MSHILALKLDCQCGGNNGPIDSVVKPISQELKCMQKYIRKVRQQQMVELFQKESEMYMDELRSRNLALWHKDSSLNCK
ncbi:uncharacterized protein LOC128255597 [Drosophila gunungcola]|uniref:Uncharacterized protein n=1 Tax=Drosophila gunungcola TaxID=103775 RepID=A0A9P9YIV0_9MUSC|nr:uncharacterized protein LOC128255597 [Drosophila gunungcola]KAI8037621.1 hypothetical protein M5D96_009785 [Drosophila gunungcola]